MDSLEHELLVRIDERMKQMYESLAEIKKMNDLQNGRISKMENWQSKIVGCLILIAVILPIII